MLDHSFLISLLISMAIGFGIWLVLGALTLRGACVALKLEEIPGFAYSALVTFVSGCTISAAAFAVGYGIDIRQIEVSDLTANVLGLLIVATVTPTVYAVMLHQTYGRSILVWVIQLLLMVAAVIVLSLLYGAVMTVFFG
ncbi:MAG: hypothetical protein KC800_24230 [Candidatus Eremiobacteraeota bacterium]|nr:hypothetical protein [Candidatus Eremiobacteraeota bacterium]